MTLAKENVNNLMEGSSQARVEVEVYELQNDSQYTTTDTSMCQHPSPVTHVFVLHRHSTDVTVEQ